MIYKLKELRADGEEETTTPVSDDSNVTTKPTKQTRVAKVTEEVEEPEHNFIKNPYRKPE